MNLDYRVDGFEDVLTIGVRAEARIKEELFRLLGEAASIALESMRRRVPRGQNPDPYHRTIYSSLDMDGIVYRPGAPGGGGFYEVNVGALRNPPEQLRYIMEGTDRYPAVGNIGNVMAISKLGEPVRYRTKREGQKPQTDWFTESYRIANAFIAEQIRHLDIL